eukprot:GHVN01102611.1.p1 GENE.GHVN01102611.1~~GHVN01102611.1.p1  ORF type:complete len:227 (+),score=53.77 GHVN01102611.1:255-935(+)
MPARSTPLTWDELTTIITSNTDMSQLQRSDKDEIDYQLHRRWLNETWVSTTDFILHTKFDFERRPLSFTLNTASEERLAQTHPSCIRPILPSININKTSLTSELPHLPHLVPAPPNGTKWAAHPPLSKTKIDRGEVKEVDRGEVMLRLSLNDFPYYLSPGMEHWCLWKLNGGELTPIEINKAKQELKRMKSELGELVSTLDFINPIELKTVPEIEHAHIMCLRSFM